MRMIALSLLAVAALSAWPCSPALAAEGVIDTVAGNGSRIFGGDGRVCTLGCGIHCDAGSFIRDTVQVLVPAGGGS